MCLTDVIDSYNIEIGTGLNKRNIMDDLEGVSIEGYDDEGTRVRLQGPVDESMQVCMVCESFKDCAFFGITDSGRCDYFCNNCIMEVAVYNRNYKGKLNIAMRLLLRIGEHPEDTGMGMAYYPLDGSKGSEKPRPSGKEGTGPQEWRKELMTEWLKAGGDVRDLTHIDDEVGGYSIKILLKESVKVLKTLNKNLGFDNQQGEGLPGSTKDPNTAFTVPDGYPELSEEDIDRVIYLYLLKEELKRRGEHV